MEHAEKYSLLILDKECRYTEKDFENISSTYSIKFVNKLDNSADIILDLESLELYHAYNNELIIKLNSLAEISKITSTDFLEKIKMVDFDTELAIEMLGGSKKVFNNILNNYYTEYKDVEERLSGLLINTEWENIRKIVHKIKGVSLYVGSEKLLAYAMNLENKIYNNIVSKDDVLNFNNYHNRILKYVKEMVENV